jgi:hypothetical protein
MPTRPEFIWTGEYQEVEINEWWCPTFQQWVDCGAPCPDGTLHRTKRARTIRAKVLRPKKVGVDG